MEPHADLLCAAQALLHSCGYKVELAFVCRHQDSGIPMVLAWDAWLNIEADVLAKDKASTPHLGPACYKLPGNAWACYAGNCRIVKQFDGSLQSYINRQESWRYWEKQKVLHPDILSCIDWSTIGHTMKESTIDWWHWVSKQMSGHFAHGKNMVCWKQRMMAKCPWCDENQEDKAHIITCPQEAVNSKWKESLDSLEQWMEIEQSDPQLTTLLNTGLQTWHNGEDPPQDSLLTQQQASIGWTNALDGWLTVEWHAQQGSILGSVET